MKKIRGTMALLLLAALSAQAQDLTIRSDKKGRLGYFDEDGKEVIKCQFDEAEPFRGGYAKVLKGDDYGIINVKGKFVSGKYSVMTEYGETGFYLVAEGGKEPKPGKAEKPGKSRAGIRASLFRGSMDFPVNGAKWGIITREGKEIVKVAYEEISALIDGVIYVNQGGKWGFFDEQYHLIVKPTYSAIGAFNDDGITWVKTGGKPGGTKTLNPVTSTKLALAMQKAVNVSASTWVGGKTGVIDKNGRVIVPVQYSYLGTFEPCTGIDSLWFSSRYPVPEGHVPFTMLPSWDETYIWYANKLKPYYGNVWKFSSYQYHYATDFGMTDINGRKLIPEKRFSIIFRPTNGMMRYFIVGKKKRPGTGGCDDLENKRELVTDGDYSYAPFHQGVAKVMNNSGTDFFFVNKTLSEVSAHYSCVYDFNEGFSVVKKGDRYGAIDLTGSEVIAPSYTWMSKRFSGGVVAAGNVVSSGKSKDDSTVIGGYIDGKGEVVIPFEYTRLGDFRDGLAIVGHGNRMGIIDIKGQEVLPIEWEDFIYPQTTGLRSDYFWVRQDKKYYFYDMERQAIVFPEKGQGYSEAFVFTQHGLAIVRRGGTNDLELIQKEEQKSGKTDIAPLTHKSSESLYGAVTRDGREVIPCQFKFKEIDAAWRYMQKNGLTHFREVDIKRLRITLRGTSNTYPLSAVIPDDEWDY